MDHNGYPSYKTMRQIGDADEYWTVGQSLGRDMSFFDTTKHGKNGLYGYRSWCDDEPSHVFNPKIKPGWNKCTRCGWIEWCEPILNPDSRMERIKTLKCGL